MPFKKINTREEINKRLENNEELKNEFKRAESEYEFIKQLKSIRTEMGLSQREIARLSGLSQQAISRIETVDNSPTLRNLIKYAEGLSLDIRVEKKQTSLGVAMEKKPVLC